MTGNRRDSGRANGANRREWFRTLAAAPLCVPILETKLRDRASIGPIEVTLIDDQAIGYATFQSHNQKVVANQNGIFLTYLRTRNEPYTAQTWRLMRSRDGGRSFTVMDEGVAATNPPVLETDAEGNLYLALVDFQDGNAYLHRYRFGGGSSDAFRSEIHAIPRAAAGKYAMIIDQPRGQLYFFSHNNIFSVIGLDGTIRHQIALLKAGPHAALQYPQLALASDGMLYAGWTTQKHGVYLYWDIHIMMSEDGGTSWLGTDREPLKLPVEADDAGPARRISGTDEFEVHTWLSSMHVSGEKLFALYLAQAEPPRQHLVRLDRATLNFESDQAPSLKGDTIALQGLDGFLASDQEQPQTVYCVGSNHGRLGCIMTRDRGATWHDHARSDSAYNLYSIGGCRSLTAEGWLIGSFTDQHGSNQTDERHSRVYFFKIPTRS
jgi:hypothetical protein